MKRTYELTIMLQNKTMTSQWFNNKTSPAKTLNYKKRTELGLNIIKCNILTYLSPFCHLHKKPFLIYEFVFLQYDASRILTHKMVMLMNVKLIQLMLLSSLTASPTMAQSLNKTMQKQVAPTSEKGQVSMAIMGSRTFKLNRSF